MTKCRYHISTGQVYTHLGLPHNLGQFRAGSFQRWLADTAFINDRRLYVLHTGSMR